MGLGGSGQSQEVKCGLGDVQRELRGLDGGGVVQLRLEGQDWAGGGTGWDGGSQ